MKISLTVLKLKSGQDFHLKKFKGGVTVLIFCTLSVEVGNFTKFLENIFYSFKFIEWTRFSYC